MSSRSGRRASFAARGGTRVHRAPGTCGMASRTTRSHIDASALNCCRLKGELKGSRLFGKIFVMTSTRMRVYLLRFDYRCVQASKLMRIVHVVQGLAMGGQER